MCECEIVCASVCAGVWVYVWVRVYVGVGIRVYGCVWMGGFLRDCGFVLPPVGVCGCVCGSACLCWMSRCTWKCERVTGVYGYIW